GWLVSAGLVEDLAATMRMVLKLSVHELEQMSQIGRERVVQQHNISVEAKKLADLFRQPQIQTESIKTTVNTSIQDAQAAVMQIASDS
nr:hypothetical protein [Pleurocapsa sp. MO_192.B19]